MTASWSGRVPVEHLGAEGVLLDLGGTYLVSDHPPHFGGSGRGPTPGELLKGALSGSVALAVGAAQERGELPGRGVRVRCGFELGVEPMEGPLAQLTFLSGFVLDIDLPARLDAGQLLRVEELARGCRVARSLCEDLLLDETNIFRSGEGEPTREPVGFVVARSGRLAGDVADLGRRLTPASEAQYLGLGRALATWGASSLVVRDAEGVAPEDLLLAALATCTTVFAARIVRDAGAAARIRTTCEGRFDGGAAEPFGKLERRLEVTGALDPDQRATIDFCANHCAIGETLRRRARLTVDVRDGADAPVLATAGEGPFCDDASCCAPEPGR